MSRIAIIIGAGSTLSEAAGKSIKSRPPLDYGFFAGARAARSPELDRIRNYMRQSYAIDPIDPADDSLEGVLAVLYSDIYNPAAVQSRATQAFLDLLSLINRRIAETTNTIRPTRRKNLYRMLRRFLSSGYSPRDISILTFNQDLHIERTLHALTQSAPMKKYLPLWSFPYCYGLPKYKLSKTGASIAQFPVGDEDDTGMEILKLHGSLNWFSKHISKTPTPRTLLNPSRELWVTKRRDIVISMKFKSGRTMYTYPIVVPPVIHKASILHNDMHAIWKRARRILREAEKIIVVGYSCPLADQESASLMRRGLRENPTLRDIIIVDPSPDTFKRWVELSNRDALMYYRNTRAFLRAT